MSADSFIPPEKRERLKKLFSLGNEQMLKANYEYADNIYFTECVLQAPGNPIYTQTFLANLKKKFGDKKKTRSIIAAGKQIAVDAQKPENAFKTNIATLKANPWDIETLISMGEICDVLGFTESALVYYRNAVEADPYHIGANTACSKALRETADFDGALACVQRVLEKQPNNPDAKKMLHDISVEKTIHRGQYASGTSRNAVEAAETFAAESQDVMGRPLTIPEQIERRIAKNPADTANYAELAQWYYKQSNYAEVEKIYTRAVQASNNASDMVERLLEIQKKRIHEESLRLKEAYEKQPTEERKSIFFAARNKFDEKNMELAMHRIERYPNHSGYRYEYGMLLQKNGQVKEAIAQLQIAKAEQSRRGDCLLALGQCFQMIRQYKLAAAHYHESITVLEPGESKKKALYLAMKLAMQSEDFSLAETYGHQLAAIDYSYKDLGNVLEQISQNEH